MKNLSEQNKLIETAIKENLLLWQLSDSLLKIEKKLSDNIGKKIGSKIKD